MVKENKDVKDFLEVQEDTSDKNYEELLKEIIKNQEKTILYLQSLSKNPPAEESQLQRVLTITVFLLIIFVSIMWTIYGVNTFFM